MVLTRSQLRSKEQLVAPFVSPLRIRRGVKKFVESPVDMPDASDDSVTGFNERDANSNTHNTSGSNTLTKYELNMATTPRRVRRELEYKSIVRTRSQKLKEAENYHLKQLAQLQEFWDKWGKEPDVDSTDTEEVALASYIQNLRTVTPGNLKPEFVARVTEILPWFKWRVQEVRKSSFIDKFLAFSLLFLLIATATQMQVLMNNKDAMNRILVALSQLGATRLRGFM